VQFDAPDGRPVNMLFVLLVPEQANETHLQLLAELAQMFSDRGFRDALQSAPDAAHIHQLFLDWSSDAANESPASA
jgi:PTS system nitrogen regulatory IIA component